MNKFFAQALWSMVALLLVGLLAPRIYAQDPIIGLTASPANPAVINNTGGVTKILADVSNIAPAGSDDLDYSIEFQLPYETSDSDTDTLSPGAKQSWAYDFDATKLPMPLQDQYYPINVVVNSLGASNSPKTAQLLVEVKNPANPMFIIHRAGMPPVAIEEPTIAPEQFAATGGGETYAAAAPNVIGDPPFDAALDFDYLDEEGSSEIIARNVHLFQNQPPLQEGEDLATAGISPFDVYVDTSHVGTFTKTFFLHFSDEDIPGARPPGSIVRELTYTFIVMPEPTSGMLFLSGVALVGATRRRLRRAGT